ncbi:cupin domain-containing protein [Marinobacter zhejiangensis]|uniref:50S ribosomal protein L16 3-hydroxylase n=1 Tax=Marinobacter zhejiangensis TaxID=488535 RepID=A0A1I4RHP9_9GAMM|nr:cupin domain-containing protein [Marinobacter zhejiangensis]SFM51566.1 50S ribosomal protein L16 3-hydroxylase [Marinobacter zhejiangensis]
MELLGGLTIEEFLRDYWQKKPLVIRQALPGYQCPVSADELAGLACEDAVESRIIIENDDGRPWQLQNGPFEPNRFQSLPPTHWTLLIQGLDHWVPEVADILERFRFIPNWRLDDIMASYAPEGGSVGPHYDQYDVFLLQAEGRRQWTFGGHCDHTSPRLDGTPLRILSSWEGEETVTLEPGDILYLPPGVGHHGIAENDCITLSIGFRAPTVDDILTGFTDFLCSQTDASAHYSDPDLQPQDNPGAITPDVIDKLAGIVTNAVSDKRQLTFWFGQYTTAPKSQEIIQPSEDPLVAGDLVAQLNHGEQIRWNEGSRFAFFPMQGETALFVDGERYLLRGDAQALAPTLCQGAIPDPDRLIELVSDPALAELVTALHNQGSLYFE